MSFTGDLAPFLGESVELSGSWGEHAKFGRQFRAEVCQAIKPSTTDGVERFLASGAVRGIGKTMAARIVEHFGSDTLDVLSLSPHRLTEISGIGRKKAEAIGMSYAELSDMRELMVYLESHGVSANYAPKLQAQYGATAMKGFRRIHIAWLVILPVSVLELQIRLPWRPGWTAPVRNGLKPGWNMR